MEVKVFLENFLLNTLLYDRRLWNNKVSAVGGLLYLASASKERRRINRIVDLCQQEPQMFSNV